MRVLVVTNMYPYEGSRYYGIFVKEQVDALRELGVEVDVFFINGEESRLNYIKEIPSLVRQLRKNKYDIIHSHHTYTTLIAYFVKRILFLDTPILFTFHEPEFLKPKKMQDIQSDLLRKLAYSSRLKKIALKVSDGVISVWKGLVEKLGFRGEYWVIPCGIDVEVFKPMEKVKARELLNLPLDKKIILVPANLKHTHSHIHKGYDLFLRVKEKLESNDFLFITGGELEREKMVLYYNASDVVLQTSLFEASPTVIKEAMACNRPIVSTDAGDTRETIGETEGCFVSERRDPDVIARLILEALNYSETNGRERILKLGLDLESTANKVFEVYKTLLKRRI